MSRHVYDNLLIRNNAYVTTIQAASSTGISALSSTGSQSLQIADSGDVTLYGPQHIFYSNFQKTALVGMKTIGTVSGSVATALFSLSMPQNSQVGFKTTLGLTSDTATLAKFEEYFGVALNHNGTVSCQINQLTTSPLLALDPATVMVSGDPSMGTATTNVQGSITTFPVTYNLTITGSQTSMVSVDFLAEILGPSSVQIARL